MGMIKCVLVGLLVGMMPPGVKAETGPRLSDADLFESLNLDYAGLETVKAAWQAEPSITFTAT